MKIFLLLGLISACVIGHHMQVSACSFNCGNTYEPVCGESVRLGSLFQRNTYCNPCKMAESACIRNIPITLVKQDKCDCVIYAWGVPHQLGETCGKAPDGTTHTFPTPCDLEIANRCQGQQYEFVSCT